MGGTNPLVRYSPREAELLDPQHRIFLECAWEAVEHAGYDPMAFDVPVGVFAGATTSTYLLLNLASRPELVNGPASYQVFVGNTGDSLAPRISYKFGLRGPSFSVQSACSTSLLAVHLACQSLLSAASFDDVRFAQPFIFAFEYALAQTWLAWGVRADGMLGHSLGEYVAACLAGVFTLPGALELVVARSLLLHQTQPGAMLAVGVPVNPVLDAFRARVAEARPKAPELPFVSNVTGTWIRPEEASDPDYWVRHLRETVRFADGLATLAQRPGRVLLEVGAGQALGAIRDSRARRGFRSRSRSDGCGCWTNSD